MKNKTIDKNFSIDSVFAFVDRLVELGWQEVMPNDLIKFSHDKCGEGDVFRKGKKECIIDYKNQMVVFRKVLVLAVDSPVVITSASAIKDVIKEIHEKIDERMEEKLRVNNGSLSDISSIYDL